MKVCTDSCVFGGWLAKKFEGDGAHQKLLDIGTGTGLLSLMMAQKTQYDIDAVEIAKDSSIEASINFENSKWHDKLKCEHADILNITADNKYDLVICNPPFYKKHLQSLNDAKRNAMHESRLGLDALIKQMISFALPGGKLALLLPFERTEEIKMIVLEAGLFVNDELFIRQTANHDYFRYCIMFSKTSTETKCEEITIKINGTYSDDFVSLLKDYYLHL